MLSALIALFGCSDEPSEIVTFELEIENIAEPTETFQILSEPRPIYDVLVDDTPQGTTDAGPLQPGDSYVIRLSGPGNLSFASMFVPSNDTFFAFDTPRGLPLFGADGTPLEGDLTNRVVLWESGTEVDVAPGEGPNQAPDQPNPNTGDDENGVIAPLSDDPTLAATYPAVADVISVTLVHLGGNNFELTIANVSAPDALMTTGGDRPVIITQALLATHAADAMFFTPGEVASVGLERLAEDGDAAPRQAELETLLNTGVAPVFTPFAVVVHDRFIIPFSRDEPAPEGLEELAEQGDPMPFLDTLSGDERVRFVQVLEPEAGGIFTPGAIARTTFEARTRDRLSLLSMVVPSHDWIYGFFNPGGGVALFDATLQPLEPNLDNDLRVFDAGTEVDAGLPGASPDQAPFQDSPTDGEASDGTVTLIDLDTVGVPILDTDDVVRISVRVVSDE